MNDKEKIKVEIERLKAIADYQLENCKVGKSAWNQQVEVCEKLLSFIDSLQEEPTKKCMYTKDNFTDEDRKVLCEGCEEDCEYGKKYQKPVRDDLESEIIKRWKVLHGSGNSTPFDTFNGIACHFANWQKQQMMKNTVDAVAEKPLAIADGCEDAVRFEVVGDEFAQGFKSGDKVKIIIIKEG